MKIEKNASGFSFVSWAYGSHDSKTLILWVNRNIPTAKDDNGNEVLEFPVKSAEIQKTEKGTLVLRPSPNGTNVFLYEVRSGYRGSASVEKNVKNGAIMAEWAEYHSQTGSLGETVCALINGGNEIEVKWRRSGRRVDQTSGIDRLNLEGEQIEVLDDLEACGLL